MPSLAWSEDSPSDSDGGRHCTLRGNRSPGPTALLCSLHLVNQTTKGQRLLILCPVPCVQVISASRNALFSSCLTPACSFAIWLRYHLSREALLPTPIQATGALLPLATLPSALMTVRISRGQISQVLHILMPVPSTGMGTPQAAKEHRGMDADQWSVRPLGVCAVQCSVLCLGYLIRSFCSSVRRVTAVSPILQVGKQT